MINVGGKREKFCCIHMLAPEKVQLPVRFTCSARPTENRRKLQVHYWFNLCIFGKRWVPDLHVAKRIQAEAERMAERLKLRGGWYSIKADRGEQLICQAAGNLKIPILTTQEHDALQLDGDQLEDLKALKLGVRG